jgi:regulator of nucleoside diphosphate kinase
MLQESPIYFSEGDYERLRVLVGDGVNRRSGRSPVSQLVEELDRAEVVPEEELPSDVVAMHSTVRLTDLDTNGEHVYTVVYPHEADADRGRISVLAPIGTAVLGYRIGDIVEWEVPAGVRRFRIDEVAAEGGPARRHERPHAGRRARHGR